MPALGSLQKSVSNGHKTGRARLLARSNSAPAFESRRLPPNTHCSTRTATLPTVEVPTVLCGMAFSPRRAWQVGGRWVLLVRPLSHRDPSAPPCRRYHKRRRGMPTGPTA